MTKLLLLNLSKLGGVIVPSVYLIPPALRLGGGPESPEPLLLHTSVVMHECFIKHSTCLFKGEQYIMNQVFCAMIFDLKHDSGFLSLI